MSRLRGLAGLPDDTEFTTQREPKRKPPALTMPRLAWSEFIDRHPAAHLLIAALPDGDPIRNLRPHLDLMARLIGRLAKKEYALAIHRRPDRPPAIHCVFENDYDAQKIGDVLDARRTGGLPGWRSLRWFRLDAEARKTIGDALKPSEPARRP